MASLVNVTPASQVATVEVNNRQLNVAVQKDSKSVDVVLETRGDIAVEISRAVSQTGVQKIIAGTDITISPSNGVGNVTINAIVGNVEHANTANYALEANIANTANIAIFATDAGNANFASNAAYANNAELAGAAGLSDFVTQPNQLAITSVGILENLEMSGPVLSSGNITAPYFIGNVIGNIVGNIVVPGSQWDILFNDGGNAGASDNLRYDSTNNGLIAVGDITAAHFVGDGFYLSTINGANVSEVPNAAYATNAGYATFAGDAYTISGSNVVGTVANSYHSDISDSATIANTVTEGTQSNITSVGTLTGLSISGYVEGNLVPAINVDYNLGSDTLRWKDLYLSGNTIYLGNIQLSEVDGQLSMPAANIAGDLITTGNANISSDLNVTGNALISGNLTVNGNTYYTNVETLVVEDPIIEQGGGPNGAPLTSNDGKDRGELLHYYTTEPVDAFMGWSNANSEFIFGGNVTNTNEIISVNTYGNIRAQHVYANIDGTSVVGEVQFAGYAATAGDASTAGYATSAGTADFATNADMALSASTAGSASIADVANSVDVGNVVGIGDIATTNFNMNPASVLFGDGMWGSIPASNPSGSNTEVQFNNDGAFGSDANFTFDSTDATLRSNNISVQSNMQIEYPSASTLTTFVPASIENFVGPAPFDSGITLSQGKISLATSYYDGLTDVTNNVNILSNPDAYAPYNIMLPPDAAQTFGQTLIVDDPSTGYLVWGTPTPINSEISKPITLDVLQGTNGVTVVPGVGTAGEITLYFISADDRNSILYFGSPTIVTVAEYPSTGETTNFTLGTVTNTGDFFITYSYSNSFQYTGSFGLPGYVAFSFPALEANKLNSELDDTHIQGGTTGQVLSTDGTGTLSWIDVGGTPSGSNTQVQFNDAGVFGADANLTFNKTNGTLSATRLVGNGSLLTSLTGANVTGVVPQSNLASNITVVAGNANSASDKFFTFITANNITGNYTLESQPGMHYWPISGMLYVKNIIQVPTWSSDVTTFLTADRELRVSNRVTSGQFVSNVATGTAPFTVTSTTQVANLNVATSGTAGTVTTAAQPNITSVGTLTGLVIANGATVANLVIGNATSNITLYGNGLIDTGNIVIGSTSISGVTSLTSTNITVGSTGNLKVNNILNANSNPMFLANGAYGNVDTAGDMNLGGFLYTAQANLNIKYGNINFLDGSGVQVAQIGRTNGSGNITINSPNLSMTGGAVRLGANSNVKITGGSSGQVLTTDGLGNLSWSTGGGGGGTSPAGSNTYVQFNNAGSFGAVAEFTFDTTTNTLAATNFSGNGSGLSGVVASTAGTVTTNAQPNITSVGTLSSLDVGGISNLGANSNVIITGGLTGQVLTTNGSGNLSWTTPSSGGGAETFAPFLLAGM